MVFKFLARVTFGSPLVLSNSLFTMAWAIFLPRHASSTDAKYCSSNLLCGLSTASSTTWATRQSMVMMSA